MSCIPRNKCTAMMYPRHRISKQSQSAIMDCAATQASILGEFLKTLLGGQYSIARSLSLSLSSPRHPENTISREGEEESHKSRACLKARERERDIVTSDCRASRERERERERGHQGLVCRVPASASVANADSLTVPMAWMMFLVLDWSPLRRYHCVSQMSRCTQT